MNCYICNTSPLEHLFQKDAWEVLRCRHCGHAITHPQPDSEQLSALYNSAYFDSHYKHCPPGSRAFKKKLSDENDKLKKYITPFKKRGKLLDIGCGRGYFLAASRKAGYTPTGFDISTENATFIQETLKISLQTGPWETAEFAPSSFDIITSWHSLEHFANPRGFLQKAKNWLKKDGLLAIDVPRNDCLDVFYLKEEWSNWDVPFHLHHFSQNSLNRLLEELGFSSIKKECFHSEVVKERLKRHLIFRLMARNVAKCFHGGHYAVVCRQTSI